MKLSYRIVVGSSIKLCKNILMSLEVINCKTIQIIFCEKNPVRKFFPIDPHYFAPQIGLQMNNNQLFNKQ